MRGRRHPHGLFVTGTDTGVGKTAVACALAAWGRGQGIDVGVMKPVATGAMAVHRGRARRWVSHDALSLAHAAGVDDSTALVNPICFREPLAPWTASLRTHQPIVMKRIVEAFNVLRTRHRFLLVEGIGGLLVPFSATITVADVIEQLRLPVVIVARPALGTLNHTLLTLAAVRQRGFPLQGVVINAAVPGVRDPMGRLAERTNPQILSRFTRVLGTLPYRPRLFAALPAPERFARWVQDALGARVLERLFRT